MLHLYAVVHPVMYPVAHLVLYPVLHPVLHPVLYLMLYPTLYPVLCPVLYPVLCLVHWPSKADAMAHGLQHRLACAGSRTGSKSGTGSKGFDLLQKAGKICRYVYCCV